MKSTLLPFLACLLTCQCLSAQDFKVAVVDFKKVLIAHPQSKMLAEKFKNETKDTDAKLNKMLKRFEELDKEYEALHPKVDGKINVLTKKSIERRIVIQKEAMVIQEEMARLKGEKQSDLNEERIAKMLELSVQIRVLVKEVNGGRFALVFDSSALSREGYPQLVDFSGAADITDEVIKQLPNP